MAVREGNLELRLGSGDIAQMQLPALTPAQGRDLRETVASEIDRMRQSTGVEFTESSPAEHPSDIAP